MQTKPTKKKIFCLRAVRCFICFSNGRTHRSIGTLIIHTHIRRESFVLGLLPLCLSRGPRELSSHIWPCFSPFFLSFFSHFVYACAELISLCFCLSSSSSAWVTMGFGKEEIRLRPKTPTPHTKSRCSRHMLKCVWNSTAHLAFLFFFPDEKRIVENLEKDIYITNCDGLLSLFFLSFSPLLMYLYLFLISRLSNVSSICIEEKEREGICYRVAAGPAAARGFTVLLLVE